MAKVNLKKAEACVMKEINKNWSKLTFEHEHDDNSADITANLTLNNHDDDIRVVINVYSGGMAHFRAVFDKAEPSADLLELINKFNAESVFFFAFLRDDGYLELKNIIAFYGEKMLTDYTGEFLSRLAQLADDETLQQITKYTS